ncbi:MAG: hypothetical protein M3680_15675, partial [Myxococcota bacterium]|nr:hypothetical protein [Myxococcota bacterium]
SMQPSGPVPRSEGVAAGSGPHAGDPPVGPRPLPTTTAEQSTAWDHVLDRIEKVSISVRGAYEPARVLQWTREVLELGYPSQFDMVAEVAESKEKTDVLRRIVQDVFGHSPKIAVRTLAAAELETNQARSVLEASRERSTVERTKRESEAREHPITKHVLKTFGAQIKEIKTDV